MRTNCCLIEGLESRTLMSGSALGSQVFNDTVKADRLQVRVDLLKFRADALGSFAVLLADTAAVKRDDLSGATTVGPLVDHLKADVKQMRLTLKADRLNEGVAVLTDRIAILTDLKQILLDRGDATKLAADHQQLFNDRVKLQTDLVAGLTQRLNDRQAAFDTISADAQAVVSAVQSDPGADAKLSADLQKLMTDTTNRFATLNADMQQLLADRQKLVDDLTASQNS
jgi:hypothetical protein